MGVVGMLLVLAVTGRAAAAPCPAVAAAQPPVAAAAAAVLVPPGATSLLLCRYRGLSPLRTARHLERWTLVAGGSGLAALTAAFDALPELPKATACPMDAGGEILAIFRYANEPADPVTVGLGGCRIVSNGHVTRTAGGSAGMRLLARLSALVR
jgi:hypothetical protein